jgi:branched-chain amino acid transport system ATP-binding protein
MVDRNVNSIPNLLSVSDVSKRFGGLQALDKVGLEIGVGQIVGLIGPNGAGKTTFFNVITGLYPADEGVFKFHQKTFNPRAVNEVVELGIARTFQNIRLFAQMTVLENVMVGRHCRTEAGIFGGIFQTPATRREERAIKDRSMELLRYVGIEKYADFTAKNLSYGHQRRLEIARALATDPQLLALDEPAAGMNATEKVELRQLLEKIRNDGKTLLLIEHDVKLVMGLCDHITVLDYGRVIASGQPEQVRRDPSVIKAYLGTPEESL